MVDRNGFAVDEELPRDGIDAALLVLWIQIERRAGLHLPGDIKHRRKCRCGRALAKCGAGDKAHCDAGQVDFRHRRAGVVRERRLALLVRLRQRDPRLQSVQPMPGRAIFR